MGLDMFLNKKEINWNIPSKTKKTEEDFGKEVIYWRKANAIHSWFVDNVQKGVDDCGTYHVSKEQLEKLLELCKEIKKNPKGAEEILPMPRRIFLWVVWTMINGIWMILKEQ